MANNPQSYSSYTLPPPVGGLNYVDPIDNMPQGDARVMCNFFPDNESVKLRKGYTEVTDSGTGYAANPVKRLWNLPLANGTEKLVAAYDDSTNHLFDVSTGTLTSIEGATVPTSEEWQHVVFKNRLFIVNGADAPQVYTGTGNFANAGFTGTGLTASDAINIGAYRGRVYLVEKDTASVWYGAVGAVTGATTEFDLSDVFTRGGYLVAAGSYTNQVADTSQDLWMAVSSEGEVLLYTGSYPGDSAWSIVARYFIAKPIGYRCLISYDSDTLILTRRGLIAVSSLFQGDYVGNSGIARKVNKYIREAAEDRAGLDAWHCIYSADQRKLFLNMPLSATTSEQLVCNVDTGAWCQYTYAGSSAPYSFSNFGSEIYFGGAEARLYHAETGETDGVLSIPSDVLWAWNFFGRRGNYKRFVDARPLIVGSNVSGLGVKMERDFAVGAADSPAVMGTSSTPWGSAWGSPWGGGTTATFDRYTLGSQGHSGALRVTATFKNVSLELNAVEVRFETGGQI